MISKPPLFLLQTPQNVGANSEHAWVTWTSTGSGRAVDNVPPGRDLPLIVY